MQASLASVFVPLTVIATVLRLFAKSRNTARLSGTLPLAADDHFAILALATFSGFMGSSVYST